MERMYSELADYWRLISPVQEYEEEAALYAAVLREHATGPLQTLLELGSGGGNNASHLKRHFELTLVDLSDDMLRQSRQLNPEVAHHSGDMRAVRLGREFDAVFIHDAIDHMQTRDDLARAMTTAFLHCRSGGVALLAPDHTQERFAPSTSHGGSDDGARGARYLEWSWDPDPEDESAVTDYALMVRDERGSTRVLHDRHVHGLFPRQVWLDTLAAAGFDARARVYEHSELPEGHELFIGLKP